MLVHVRVPIASQDARTRSATDVVEGEVGDTGVELHKQGERLANATGGTEDGNLGELELRIICQQLKQLAIHKLQGAKKTKAGHTLRAEAEKARRWIIEALNMMGEFELKTCLIETKT